MWRYCSLILIITLLQSCERKGSIYWKNETINKEIRNEIEGLNNKVFQALNAADLETLKSLMSDELSKNLNPSFETSLKVNKSQLSTYKMLGEYYTECSSPDIELEVMSGTSFKDYIVRYPATNRHTYVSLMVADRAVGDMLITIIYGKSGNKWKINTINWGLYSLHGKIAPDYYEIARKCYEKSYLIDALGYMDVALSYLNPADGYFNYHSSEAMYSFRERVFKEAGEQLQSVAWEEVNTKPRFFKFSMKSIDEGVFPLFEYVSKVNIADIKALTNENKKIRALVSKSFKGIDKEKKYVLYRVFNEFPEEGKPQSYYEFRDELVVGE